MPHDLLLALVDSRSDSHRSCPAARRSQSVVDTLQQSGSAEEAFPASKKLVRHLSHGSRLIPKKRTPKKKGKSESVEEEELDEFDRPLVRLKYGDRVQVVSMDSRGWVKLARGYGYIRLENDKQLVKGECNIVLDGGSFAHSSLSFEPLWLDGGNMNDIFFA